MITNKYSRLYHRIITSTQNRTITEGYKERHHIIPRSLGGTDSKSNLVEVTAREHFILHYLLTKFTEGSDFRKMVNAFNMMAAGSKTKARYMNSRLYDANRKHISEIMRVNQTGAKNSQHGTMWIYERETLETKKIAIGQPYEENWLPGRGPRKPRKHKAIKPKDRLLFIRHGDLYLQTTETNFFRDYLIEGWTIIDLDQNKKLVKYCRQILGIEIITKREVELVRNIIEEHIESGLSPRRIKERYNIVYSDFGVFIKKYLSLKLKNRRESQLCQWDMRRKSSYPEQTIFETVASTNCTSSACL